MTTVSNPQDASFGSLDPKQKEWAAKKELQAAGDPNLPPQGASQQDVLMVAYWLISQAVEISTHSAIVFQKQIQLNANNQEKLINQEQNFQIAQVTVKELDKAIRMEWIEMCAAGKPSDRVDEHAATAAVIDKVQMHNQSVIEGRSFFEEKLTVSQQNSQRYAINLNTDINEGLESFQEDSSVAQMLASITNQISVIIK